MKEIDFQVDEGFYYKENYPVTIDIGTMYTRTGCSGNRQPPYKKKKKLKKKN
jgi:actin-related protein